VVHCRHLVNFIVVIKISFPVRLSHFVKFCLRFSMPIVTPFFAHGFKLLITPFVWSKYIRLTAGVAGLQGELTPYRHLISPVYVFVHHSFGVARFITTCIYLGSGGMKIKFKWCSSLKRIIISSIV
jgi:hypothetical protein